MKILLLCHGNLHVLNEGADIGFPLTIKMLSRCTTLDVDETSDPDIIEDITIPTKIKIDTFDVVGGVYCHYNVMITDDGDLVSNFFNNIIKILKPGGTLFINNLAPIGICMFVKFLLKNELYSDSKEKIDDDNTWYNKSLPNSMKTELLSKHILTILSNKLYIDYDGGFNVDTEDEFFIKYEKQLFFLFVLYVQHKFPQLKLLTKQEDIVNVLNTVLDKNCSDYLKETVLDSYRNDYQYSSFLFTNDK